MVGLGITIAGVRGQTTATAGQTARARTQTSRTVKDVSVTVNGAPIREADIRIALRGGGHKEDLTAGYRQNVLDVIIRKELAYQRAIALGLDANPGYQERLAQMEARISAFKRKELSELFWRKIAEGAVVGEAEARKYFEENDPRLRTELHVWQILLRNEHLIEQARSDIEGGMSFEKVAARQFPKMPKAAGAPWDLGFLRWKQVPKAWQRVVYDLKKGEVSGIIPGPNNRFWIIKLIDKRENPDITFERIRPTIMEVLMSARVEELRETTNRDLWAKASIVYLNDPVEAIEE